MCEAESHFIGYISAIIYKLLFSPKTKLLMWCFYALPGISRDRTFIHRIVKTIGRQFFDGFISYSTFGKNYLVSKGFNKDHITVAVNVCDTQHFLELDSKLSLKKTAAKDILGVSSKFIVSYIGTLDKVKRPDLLLEISKILDEKTFHFFIIGSGPMQDDLIRNVHQDGISIVLTGRLGIELPLHYRASDIVIIPGRGGIVISEAMCFGVPVIVHQADGVEYDLIIQDQTGIILGSGSARDFAIEIERLSNKPKLLTQMGEKARSFVTEINNSENMAGLVIQAVKRFA